jgi:hypothetical protein
MWQRMIYFCFFWLENTTLIIQDDLEDFLYYPVILFIKALEDGDRFMVHYKALIEHYHGFYGLTYLSTHLQHSYGADFLPSFDVLIQNFISFNSRYW